MMRPVNKDTIQNEATKKYQFPIYKNNFWFLKTPVNKAVIESNCRKEEALPCHTAAGKNNTNFEVYPWYACVGKQYRKYWRKPSDLSDEYTGYKRGERIMANIFRTYSYNDTSDNGLKGLRKEYNSLGKKDLEMYDGLLAFKNKKSKKNFGEILDDKSNVFAITISALVYLDFDIGQDAWPIVVTCVLAVIALFFVISVKIVPRCGFAMFGSCCADVFDDRLSSGEAGAKKDVEN